MHRHSSPVNAAALPQRLPPAIRDQQISLTKSKSFVAFVQFFSLRQLYKQPLAAAERQVQQVHPPWSHFKTKHNVGGRGQVNHRSRSMEKAQEPHWTGAHLMGHSCLCHKHTRWPSEAVPAGCHWASFGWIWWLLKWTEHCQSSSRAGSSAWRYNTSVAEAECYWNAQCYRLWEKSLTAIHFTFISIGVTPLSSSTLNTELTKLHISHTLSAASHSELLCVLGIYCSILHWFAEWSSETSQVTVLIYTGRAARPNHPNSPGMAAVYSTILTVLYAVPEKLWESSLLFQMPPRNKMENEKTRMEHKKEQRNCCQKLFLSHPRLRNLFR